MTTDLDTRPDLADGDTDDDGTHIVCCCSTNIALCGKDVSGDSLVEGSDWDDKNACKRCLELEVTVCVLCGYDPRFGCYCGKCE